MAEKDRRFSVIIPVFNEARTLETALKRVFDVALPTGFAKEIVVVDDGSTDGTEKILQSWRNKTKLIRHEKNSGKGAAVITGLKNCTGDIVVIHDADLEYDPVDWISMVGPILDGRADVVYGSRLVTNLPHRVMYFWHYLGNNVITFVSNMFTNLNLTDMETGQKMMTKTVVDSIKDKLVSKRFGIEPELTARMKKFRIFEVGISYSGRTYKDGKKITWKDGLAVFWHIVRFNIFSR